MLPTPFTHVDADPLDVFTLERRLGRGSFGEVYAAVHRASGQAVALKTIDIGEMDERAVERTLTEIEIMRDARHANIVRFYGNYYCRRTIFIAMERADGGSVQELLVGRQKRLGAALDKSARRAIGLTESQARHVMAGLFEALKYLHDERIVHRDIKVSERECVRVTSRDLLVRVCRVAANRVAHDSCVAGAADCCLAHTRALAP